ncbi:hypothetical protein MVES1_003379 [Malassezia vespertilionis]|uniref:Uncharacterized protein n=1 Tax=Malassezia vespertilionis TaxID=2020962 RepID=A0A2N1J7A2_9BASI|nr:uncharacterized protein MVES1_003379 [Malassezia vespertilionis]PKI82437.1 hypothetical protein MVES_003620 [Malassezia vespertilionis]WFD08010.1 hypothetical protein MVES1_003379 [Malassezia vespertilionis]
MPSLVRSLSGNITYKPMETQGGGHAQPRTTTDPLALDPFAADPLALNPITPRASVLGLTGLVSPLNTALFSSSPPSDAALLGVPQIDEFLTAPLLPSDPVPPPNPSSTRNDTLLICLSFTNMSPSIVRGEQLELELFLFLSSIAPVHHVECPLDAAHARAYFVHDTYAQAVMQQVPNIAFYGAYLSVQPALLETTVRFELHDKYINTVQLSPLWIPRFNPSKAASAPLSHISRYPYIARSIQFSAKFVEDLAREFGKFAYMTEEFCGRKRLMHVTFSTKKAATEAVTELSRATSYSNLDVHWALSPRLRSAKRPVVARVFGPCGVCSVQAQRAQVREHAYHPYHR